MNEEATRSRISRHYTRRVSELAAVENADVRAAVTKLADYDASELCHAPEGAVSFGCGNPLAFSEVRPGDVVLDLGSGAGLDLLIASRRVGPSGRVIGVDMTDAMLDRARQNVREAGCDNVEVRKGTIENLPVESASVDWVISNCVINLSPDKQRVFAEIARVLAPGGRMRITDIVAQDVPGWARRAAALVNPCVGSALSEESYLAGLRAAGLSEVAVMERLVYSASQIAPIVQAEIPAWLARSLTLSGARGQRGLVRILRRFEGRVWSARLCARKLTDNATPLVSR